MSAGYSFSKLLTFPMLMISGTYRPFTFQKIEKCGQLGPWSPGPSLMGNPPHFHSLKAFVVCLFVWGGLFYLFLSFFFYFFSTSDFLEVPQLALAVVWLLYSCRGQFYNVPIGSTSWLLGPRSLLLRHPKSAQFPMLFIMSKDLFPLSVKFFSSFFCIWLKESNICSLLSASVHLTRQLPIQSKMQSTAWSHLFSRMSRIPLCSKSF